MPYPEITQITPLPPRGSDPAVFTASWNTFFSEQPQFIDDVNAAGQFIEGAAESSQQAITAAGIALSAANFVGNWADISGTLAVPASVYHVGQYWQLLNDISSVQASEPGVSADWTPASVLQGQAVGDIDMSGFGLSVDTVNYASVATTTTLDFALAQSFRVDATEGTVTLVFANIPVTETSTIMKINIIGDGLITWPPEAEWDTFDSLPPLFEPNRSRVLVDFDNGNIYLSQSMTK